MKYEAPELTALTPAINAIQGPMLKPIVSSPDSFNGQHNEGSSAYADWE